LITQPCFETREKKEAEDRNMKYYRFNKRRRNLTFPNWIVLCIPYTQSMREYICLSACIIFHTTWIWMKFGTGDLTKNGWMNFILIHICPFTRA
jgi:hypothetical protein